MFGSMVGNLAASTMNNYNASYTPSSQPSDSGSWLSNLFDTLKGSVPLLGKEKEASQVASTVHSDATGVHVQDSLIMPIAIGVAMLVVTMVLFVRK